MSVTIENCIKVLDKILASHDLCSVDYKAMREASKIVKEYKEQLNHPKKPDNQDEVPSGASWDERGSTPPESY